MSVGGTHRNQRPSLIEMLTGGTELSALVGVRTSVGSGGTTSGSGSATSATLAPNTLPNTLGPQMTSSSGTRTPSDTASSQQLGKRGMKNFVTIIWQLNYVKFYFRITEQC